MFSKPLAKRSSVMETADSYKIGHHDQDADLLGLDVPFDMENFTIEELDMDINVDPATGFSYFYLEARKGAEYPRLMLACFQRQLRILEQLVTQEDIDKVDAMCTAHLGPGSFNREGWEYILREHGGRLPIEIWSTPEGELIPIDMPLVVVKNTDPNCRWLPSFLETFLMKVWYPSSVATRSWYIKQAIKKFHMETCDGDINTAFTLHDFGGRSYTSEESAQIGGLALLYNSLGTDTMQALYAAQEVYPDTGVAAYSVVATEHSIMMNNGVNGEIRTFWRALRRNPTAIFSAVCDTFSMKTFIRFITVPKVVDVIKGRPDPEVGPPSKLVMRPDSGVPVTVSVWMMEELWRAYGGHVNSKGYRVLHPKIGMIYGDGMNEVTIPEVLQALQDAGFAASNIVFGAGSALIQKDLNRDTQKMAYKKSARRSAEMDSEWVPVQKKPADACSDVVKTSKPGCVITIKENGEYSCIVGELDDPRCVLKLRFRNGEMIGCETLAEIRSRTQGI
jgi:nicotinamide phosphoribosyltransferase